MLADTVRQQSRLFVCFCALAGMCRSTAADGGVLFVYRRGFLLHPRSYIHLSYRHSVDQTNQLLRTIPDQNTANRAKTDPSLRLVLLTLGRLQRQPGAYSSFGARRRKQGIQPGVGHTHAGRGSRTGWRVWAWGGDVGGGHVLMITHSIRSRQPLTH